MCRCYHGAEQKPPGVQDVGVSAMLDAIKKIFKLINTRGGHTEPPARARQFADFNCIN